MFFVYLAIIVVVSVVSFKYGKSNNRPAPVKIGLSTFEPICDHLVGKFGETAGNIAFQTASYLAGTSGDKIALAVKEEAKKKEGEALKTANDKEVLAENEIESSEEYASYLEEQARKTRSDGKTKANSLRSEAQQNKNRALKLNKILAYMN